MTSGKEYSKLVEKDNRKGNMNTEPTKKEGVDLKPRVSGRKLGQLMCLKWKRDNPKEAVQDLVVELYQATKGTGLKPTVSLIYAWLDNSGISAVYLWYLSQIFDVPINDFYETHGRVA